MSLHAPGIHIAIHETKLHADWKFGKCNDSIMFIYKSWDHNMSAYISLGNFITSIANKRDFRAPCTVCLFFPCVRACVSRCFYWMAYSISTVLSVCEFHSQQQHFVTNNVIIKYILPTKVFVYLNHSTWNNYSPRKRAVLRRVVFHCANVLCWVSEKQRKGESDDEGRARQYFCVICIERAFEHKICFCLKCQHSKRKQLIIQ